MNETKKNYRLENLLKDYIPNDHSRQVTSKNVTNSLFDKNNEIINVLDLGCGAGSSIDYFKEKNDKIKWVGLDIEDSPGVISRNKTDGEFYTYNGINIPFDDNHFDLIFSNQVFEHVRYPIDLLKDVTRVLKPSGYFVGSTSQLEPYHSFSLWNYTPYGFSLLINEAGMRLKEIRPSIDSLTLIIRRGLGRPSFFSRWWEKESPLNRIISILGKITGKSPWWINNMKLIFCGQFCFMARKTRENLEIQPSGR